MAHRLRNVLDQHKGSIPIPAKISATNNQAHQNELIPGAHLSPQRDWGHARDYVDGVWLALNHPQPEDFIFATGILHSVQDVVERAFATVQFDRKPYVRHDPRISRPAEPRQLVGNPLKAKDLLGWQPKTTFEKLITKMTDAELAALSNRRPAQ